MSAKLVESPKQRSFSPPSSTPSPHSHTPTLFLQYPIPVPIAIQPPVDDHQRPLILLGSMIIIITHRSALRSSFSVM